MSVFEETKPQESPTAKELSNEEILTNLVGEDKKFKTVEDLARGKKESDDFIERLLSEKEEMRKELQKAITMEELKTQLTSKEEPSTEKTEPSNFERNEGSLSEDVVQKMLDERLNEFKTSSVQEQNEAETVKKLRDIYGDDDNIRMALSQKSREIGVPMDELKNYARTNPNLLLGLMKPEVSTPKPSPSVDTGKIPTTGSKKNYAYYEKIRKEDKNLYYSAKIQQEMHKAAQEQGEGFYS